MPLPDRLTVDTNCFVYALEDPDGARGRFVLEQVLSAPGRQLLAPTLVVAELLARPYALGRTQQAGQLLRALQSLPTLTLVPLSVELAQLAAKVRAELQLTLPDAIVVATARQADAMLLSNDRRVVAKAAPSALLLDDLAISP